MHLVKSYRDGKHRHMYFVSSEQTAVSFKHIWWGFTNSRKSVQLLVCFVLCLAFLLSYKKVHLDSCYQWLKQYNVRVDAVIAMRKNYKNVKRTVTALIEMYFKPYPIIESIVVMWPFHALRFFISGLSMLSGQIRVMIAIVIHCQRYLWDLIWTSLQPIHIIMMTYAVLSNCQEFWED